MKKELFTIYETDDGIVLEIKMRTVSIEELEEVLEVIRALIPKG